MGTELQEELPPVEPVNVKDPHIGELGKALGLDKEFVSDVQARGQNALLDRAQSVDKRGGLGIVLSMCQRLGSFIQERMESGQPKLQQYELIEAIAQLGEQHDVDPFTAVRLIGTVLEVQDRAGQTIIRGAGNDSKV